jgi:hypothetical protein
LSTDAPVTWGCPLGIPPGGERHVSGRIQKAHAPNERGMICLSCCGTRPSLGPETRAHKSALNLLGDTPRGCRVRNNIAVGQTRESGRNRHRGWSESGECAARHSTPLPQGRGRVEKEKEEGRGLRPCEETRDLVWLPACRKNAVAEVGRRRLVPNTLGKRALKKGGQGRVNGDLARSVRRRVKPPASRSGERTLAGRAHRTKTGANRPRPTVT